MFVTRTQFSSRAHSQLAALSRSPKRSDVPLHPPHSPPPFLRVSAPPWFNRAPRVGSGFKVQRSMFEVLDGSQPSTLNSPHSFAPFACFAGNPSRAVRKPINPCSSASIRGSLALRARIPSSKFRVQSSELEAQSPTLNRLSTLNSHLSTLNSPPLPHPSATSSPTPPSACSHPPAS